MPDSNITYFAYLRKSSESKERQALSIGAQQQKIEEYFPDLDIEFIAEERSAFKPFNRPNFTSMLKRIEEGERRGLIAWHPDRLSRNELDAAQIVYMLRSGSLHDLKLATYPFDNTPEGIWMLQNALSQSQYESAKKGRDVRRGLEQKALQGHPPYPAIVGYRNTLHLERGFKQWEEDPERFQLVRQLWDLILTGNYNPDQLHKIAKEQLGLTSLPRKRLGGRPLSRSAIYRLFREPAYSGRFEYPKRSDTWYEGAYPAMVSSQEFEKVQALLDDRSLPPSSNPQFRFKHVHWCGECGSRATAEQKHRGRCRACKHKFSALNRKICPKCDSTDIVIASYHYYRCTHRRAGFACRQGAVTDDQIFRALDSAWEKVRIPKPVMSWQPKKESERWRMESEQAARKKTELRKQLDQKDQQLARLIVLRTNHEITADEFANSKERLTHEKRRITSALETVTKDRANREDQFRGLLKQMHMNHLALRSDKIESFKPLIEALLEEGSKPLLLDREPLYCWAKWVYAAQDLSRVSKRIHRGFETRKRRLTERQIHQIYDRSTPMLWGWDSNPRPLG